MAGLAALTALLGLPGSAGADGTQFPGTRPLGTGGAMRAMATGDAGPMLNPSGMSLVRAYIVDGTYQYGRKAGSHDAHVSAVDSTSAFNLGGALYYTYHYDDPGAGFKDHGHILGGSLSFPFGDVVYIGGTIKYLRLTSETPLTEEETTKDISFDVGLTVRAGRVASIGLVGYNLNDPGTQAEPLAFGGGVAVAAIPSLVVVADAVLQKIYGDPARSKAVYVMGGAEWEAVKTLAVRLGGGRDGLSENGYISGGVSMIAEIGALDFSFRQDVSGSVKETYLGFSGRLFVPSP